MPRVQFTKHLVRYFPRLVDGEFEGRTLAEVIAAIDRAHPGLAGYLLDDQGELRKHVNLFLGDDLVPRQPERLHDPLPAGATVSIFQSLAGG